MATCYDRYYRRYYTCNSRWSSWGRWVALAVIVIAAIILFFMIACISQRRRRKAGRQPFYGTGSSQSVFWSSKLTAVGWTTKLPGAGPPPPYQNNTTQQQWPQQNQYGGNQDANQNYGQAPQGGYYGQNQGQNQSYFGGQRDVEMQAPQNVYANNNTGSYAPPPGPPPSKVH